MGSSKDSKESEAPTTYKVVRYIGTSNVRRISKEDWAKAGVDHETVEWHRDAPLNDVPIEQFKLSPQDFNRCIVADRDLRVIELSAE